MPFLDQDRVRELRRMGDYQYPDAAVVCMLEIQTTLLKEIRDNIAASTAALNAINQTLIDMPGPPN